MICGGFTQWKKADDHIKKLFKDNLTLIGKTLGEDIDSFKVLKYQSQVVAGTNYTIQAKVNGLVVEVKLFEPLPHEKLPCKVEKVEKLQMMGGMSNDWEKPTPKIF